MTSRFPFAIALAIASSLTPASPADLRLPHVIDDHMVIQQGQPVVIHGWSDPGETVNVAFAGATAHGRAGEGGRWTVTLPALAASRAPRTLTISAGSESRDIADVLVGEVWLCSGQSNMVWRMQNSDDFEGYRADADRPTIRMFTAALVAATQPRDDVNGRWTVCTPESVGGFSAVAYHFGRELSDTLDVPIGLVNSSWGGSRAEAWIGPERLGSVAPGRAAIAHWDAYRVEVERDPTERSAADVDDRDWLEGVVPGRFSAFGVPDGDDGIFWQRQTIRIPESWSDRDLVLSLGMIDDDDVTYFNATEVGRTRGWQTRRTYTVPGALVRSGPAVLAIQITDGSGPGGQHGPPEDLYVHPVGAPDDRLSLAGPARLLHAASTRGMPAQHRPSQLHHGMLHPFKHNAFAGVTWYQGENNAIGVGSAEDYAVLLPLLIEDWRDFLHAPDLPFLIVQLANLAHAENGDWDFPLVREIQRKTQHTVPHVGLAVTIDIGDALDIHPRNKHDVGERLARWALEDTYGHEIVGPKSGPMPRKVSVRDDLVTIAFDVFDSTLAASRDDALGGFEIAGNDGVYHAATARIAESNTVVLEVPDAARGARSVRYAWRPDPVQSNLVGAWSEPAHGRLETRTLPATPFQVDIP